MFRICRFGIMVLAMVSLVHGSRGGLNFSIWRTDSEMSSAGMLMVSVNGASRGNVCSRYNSGLISLQTAQVICKSLDYPDVEKRDYRRYGYSFSEYYSSRLRDLSCTTNVNDCTYTSSSSCDLDYYYTFISCTCNLPNTHNNTNGQGCVCDAGYGESSEECTQCLKDTYSPVNSSFCTPCTPGSHSDTGSVQPHQCNCSGGLYKEEETCKTCSVNYYSYPDSDTCTPCPGNSTATIYQAFCTCPAGYMWNYGMKNCKQCEINKYSHTNSTQCTDCTPGSHSDPGSYGCNCSGGLYMTRGRCQTCQEDFYSYRGSDRCTPCPGNSTATTYQGFCTCPAGYTWNYGVKNCTICPVNHYSPSNATECTACPDLSVSTKGSSRCNCSAGYKWMKRNETNEQLFESIHFCEMCPEHTFSKVGSPHCRPCPHFKTAAAGSEFCYRCTFGQYWQNHACLPCPANLYGDGVHCNECPSGFTVDQGFCYKMSSGSWHYLVFFASVAAMLASQCIWSNRYHILNLPSVLKQKFEGERRRSRRRSDVKVNFQDVIRRAEEDEIVTEYGASQGSGVEAGECAGIPHDEDMDAIMGNVYEEQIYAKHV